MKRFILSRVAWCRYGSATDEQDGESRQQIAGRERRTMTSHYVIFTATNQRLPLSCSILLLLIGILVRGYSAMKIVKTGKAYNVTQVIGEAIIMKCQLIVSRKMTNNMVN